MTGQRSFFRKNNEKASFSRKEAEQQSSKAAKNYNIFPLLLCCSASLRATTPP
jgi:hypothetical protein